MSSSHSQRVLHLSPPSHTKVVNDNLSTKKMLENPTKILHFSQVHCIVNCSRSAATVISGWSLFEISLLTFLLKIEEKRNDHTGGQRYHRKNMSPHRRMALSSMSLKWWARCSLSIRLSRVHLHLYIRLSSSTSSLLLALATSAPSPITYTRSRINLAFARAAVMLSLRLIWPVINCQGPLSAHQPSPCHSATIYQLCLSGDDLR